LNAIFEAINKRGIIKQAKYYAFLYEADKVQIRTNPISYQATLLDGSKSGDKGTNSI